MNFAKFLRTPNIFLYRTPPMAASGSCSKRKRCEKELTRKIDKDESAFFYHRNIQGLAVGMF